MGRGRLRCLWTGRPPCIAVQAGGSHPTTGAVYLLKDDLKQLLGYNLEEAEPAKPGLTG